MEDINFNSINELYARVKPALNSKVKELKMLGKTYATDKDVFEYLTKNIWVHDTKLTLDKIVDDILHYDNDKIDEYIQRKIIENKIKNIDRKSD